jgi:hypothetical protein
VELVRGPDELAVEEIWGDQIRLVRQNGFFRFRITQREFVMYDNQHEIAEIIMYLELVC